MKPLIAALVLVIVLWAYADGQVPIIHPSGGGGGGGAGPALVSVTHDESMFGMGTALSPLGVNPPLRADVGGSGVVNPVVHGLLVGEGAAAFNSLLLAKDTFIEGGTLGTAADPLTTVNVTIGSTGHLQIRDLAANRPTIGGDCGTSPSIVGNDYWFKVTVGSGVVTSCTVFFNTAMPGGAICIPSASQNLTTYSSMNPVMATEDAAGTFVKLTGQSAGADIGCETVKVNCAEVVQ